MRLNVDCSWQTQDKEKRGQVIISYLGEPRYLFPDVFEDEIRLHVLSDQYLLEGPKVLSELKKLAEKYSDNLYPQAVYYFALKDYEYTTEAEKLLKKTEKKFGGEVLVFCMRAENLLLKRDLDAFLKLFNKQESLLGTFPNRPVFYFKEALYFHKLWMDYFKLTKNTVQLEKHGKFSLIIVDTLKKLCSDLQKPNLQRS